MAARKGGQPQASKSKLSPHGSEMPIADEMLRAILESASQGIITVGSTGKVMTANNRVAEMLGYTQSELIGMDVDDLLPEALREAHVAHRTRYFDSPRTRPMGVGLDLAARRKDGTEFPVEISLSHVTAGSTHAAIAFISDITERKTMETRLLQSQKLEAVGRLAGGIAHDFNNLLTIIMGYDRLLLEKLTTFDPLRGYAEEISKAAERAAALTKQLLAFSRRQIIQPRIVNLNTIIVDTERMLRRLIPENVEFVTVLRPELGSVKVDPSQFQQVLLNLVVNARDAMPGGGRIVVETSNVELDKDYARTHAGVKPGPYVLMSVTDNGTGMDAETKSHIFEPFFTTKPVDQGTGLGLATVYGIVKQSGGDVWVYSEIGRGTTFKIYLPRIAEPEEGDSRSVTVSPARGTETILVVEDEAGVRQLLAQVLKEQGYTVLVAGDALEAVQMSVTHPGDIHLLLTDVVMPHASGREVADRLQKTRPGLKVLYISGYTENTIVHHGVLEAEIDFLAKPFAFDLLLAKVRNVLDR